MAEKPQPHFDSSAIVVPDEEAAARRPYLRRHRALLLCCGCSAALAVLLGTAALVLVLTVFKVEDPVLAMDAAEISDHGRLLTVDVSIANPNIAPLRFDGAVTRFQYGGGAGARAVGAASAPGGLVGARRSATASAAVAVAGGDGEGEGEEEEEEEEEEVIASYTEVRGRVELLGFFRRDVDVTLRCILALDFAPGEENVEIRACRT